MTPLLVIAGTSVELEQLPALLAELDLLPLLVRRFIERTSGLPFVPTREEQIAFQQAFLARERISDQASLATWLQAHAISEPQMSQRLYRSLQLEQFKQATFGPRVDPLFLERKASLDRVTYSLMRVRQRAKAVELHLRLQEEEATFADLASMYSEGIEQQLNGLIGPMELGRINPVLAERLRISSPGQLWPPFEAEGWWVILRHERHIPAQLDASMQDRLMNEMYEVWMHEQVSLSLLQLQPNDPPAEKSAATSQSDVMQEGLAPCPSAELPKADALQPSPATVEGTTVTSSLFKSVFNLD